ncbi:MAG: hypothetical protein E7055_01885 [Lentisphaerae bacterium]|nr:hypothetical protein [Lentisphaerota bacterium]
MSTNTEFYSKMLNSFIELMDTNGACDTILRVLTANCKRNAQKENGQQQTVMTVKPAFRIEYDAQGNITIRTKLDVQEIETNHFEVEVKFNPGLAMQPDLGLDAPADQKITEESFYDRVCGLDLREADLNMYFAQMPVKDFEHWLAEGNNRQLAAKILTDDRTRDDFRELVTSTLEALEDADEDTAEE